MQAHSWTVSRGVPISSVLIVPADTPSLSNYAQKIVHRSANRASSAKGEFSANSACSANRASEWESCIRVGIVHPIQLVDPSANRESSANLAPELKSCIRVQIVRPSANCASECETCVRVHLSHIQTKLLVDLDRTTPLAPEELPISLSEVMHGTFADTAFCMRPSLSLVHSSLPRCV